MELYKMSHGTASVPLQNFFTLAPQHVPTRGHSWKLVKPHSSTDTRRFFFYVRVSSTNGTVFHKRQLMWTGSRTSWTGSGTAGWVSLWTHSPRYKAVQRYDPVSDLTPQLQQMFISSHWCSCTRWANAFLRRKFLPQKIFFSVKRLAN